MIYPIEKSENGDNAMHQEMVTRIVHYRNETRGGSSQIYRASSLAALGNM